jgi:hypothetical protein
VFALILLFPIASNANEFTSGFVGDIVSGCVEWLDTGTQSAFDNEWLLSEETARSLRLAEKFPELAPTSLHFYSPGLSYVAILKSHVSSCSVADNFIGVDETGVVASPAVEFNLQSALTALNEWGSEQASSIGFIEWPEEAERKLLNTRKDFIFFKSRCDDGDLVTIQATAETKRVSMNGLPLPAWQIVVSRYSMSDENFAEYVLRACPRAS